MKKIQEKRAKRENKADATNRTANMKGQKKLEKEAQEKEN